jgi:branched-chain amino acid transport system ATP-binding protein
MTNAINVLQREHRAIAAVLHCFEHVLAEIRSGNLEPEFALFEAIIEYLQDFPDRFHHPKEDEQLFPLIRERAPETKTSLDELAQQHHEGVRLTSDLKWKLAAWRESPKTGFGEFLKAAQAYIDFQRLHIGLEEREIIPAARAKLQPADWQRIDAAFASNEDPMFGRRPRKEFDALFSRIVSLAPEPHGFAQRRKPKQPLQSDPEFREHIVSLHWI